MVVSSFSTCLLLKVLTPCACSNHNIACINGLLTECEVCTGKYLPEVFVHADRATKERGLCVKTEGKYYPVHPYRPSNRG